MKTFNVVFLQTIEMPLMHFYHSTDDFSRQQPAAGTRAMTQAAGALWCRSWRAGERHTLWVIKTVTLLLSISLSIIDRLSKFFYQQTL